MTRPVFFVLCALLWSQCGAQLSTTKQLDSLSDESLLELFDKFQNDSIQAERVARVYLERARAVQDTIKMARAYDRLAVTFHPKKNLMFADSVIQLTKDLIHVTYPAQGYILRGYAHHNSGDLHSAIENYLIAHKLSKARNNVSQEVFLSDVLIYYKSIWGDKKEALSMQKHRHVLLSKPSYINGVLESTRTEAQSKIDELLLDDQITSYQTFAFCHLNLKQLDSARYYLQTAESILEKYNGFRKKIHSVWNMGALMEIEFYEGNHHKSIEIANNVISNSAFNLTSSDRMNLYLFKGLSEMKIGQKEKGVSSLTKADSIFHNTDQIIQPYKRMLFRELLDYYRFKGNDHKRIEYLNKLIYIDSILKRNYQFFEPELIKTFETSRLVSQRDELVNKLDERSRLYNRSLWIGLIFVLSTSILLLYYYRRQLIYKNRYENLKRVRSYSVRNINKNSNKQEISNSIINSILVELSQFEKEQLFLDTELSLQNLATRLKTNPKYLSHAINLQKGKNFSRYINSLRTEYAFNRLRTDPKLRKYTVKAIAKECGFNRAESFSKAFYQQYGIYPSYYVKQLEKEANDSP